MNRRWFLLSAAALLVAGVSADARMHAPYRGHRIQPSAAPLDGLTTPSGAYSFRKLRSAYAGPAVQLRRVDTTTQNVGFVGSDFDTAAATAFCTTACTVSIWYDQSGNSRNLTQATPANQPPYVASCIGALPCLSVTSPQGLASASFTPNVTLTLNAVGRHSVTGGSGPGACSYSGFGSNAISQHASADVTNMTNGGTAIQAPATRGAWHTHIGEYNAASSVNRVDAAETAGSISAAVTSGTIGVFGGPVAANTCQVSEMVAWNGYGLTPAERTALQQNQNNYWIPQVVGIANPAAAYSFRKIVSLYNGPAVKLRRLIGTQDIGFTPAGDFDTAAATTFCTATNCFIETWYDQSGLGRHVVQGNPPQQPAFIFNCIGSLPCARTTAGGQGLFGPSVTPAAGAASFSSVARTDAGSAVCTFIQAGAQQFGNNGTIWLVYNGGALGGAATLTAWHAGSGVINSASSVVNVDGVETPGSVAPVTTAGAMIVALGDANPCSYTEAVWWNNYALTPAERTALQQNQQNYWMPAPLDTFATPAGAYSFRKLKSSYAGPAIRLRRASDNAEVDINFLGCTGFTGCPIDTAAATAHCAATTCFLSKWYDQSGNARDLAQAGGSAQPAYIASCNGTLPCAQTTVSAQNMSAGSVTPTAVMSYGAVARHAVRPGGCHYLATNFDNTFAQAASADTVTLAGSGAIAATATGLAWHAHIGVMNGASSAVRVDGAETTGTVNGNAGTGPMYFSASADLATCNWGELLWWNGYALTAGERAALQANQKSFWGTP